MFQVRRTGLECLRPMLVLRKERLPASAAPASEWKSAWPGATSLVADLDARNNLHFLLLDGLVLRGQDPQARGDETGEAADDEEKAKKTWHS